MPVKRTTTQTLCQGSTLVCLCLAACFLSTPLNGLSPSLTLVARDLGFTEKERDIYLGGYVGIATMTGQMLGSCFSGALADKYSRSWLLIGALLLDAASTFTFSLPFISFNIMLLLRVFVGGCQGAAVPVIFSLIGDFYGVENRATVSAIVSSFLGGGMMLGQLFVGYCLPYYGWRKPFVALAAASLGAAAFLYKFLADPLKGGNEVALEEMLNRGISLPAMSMATLVRSLLTPTSLLLLMQTIPNTVPWGVLSTHLHDLLATDAHLSIPEATSLIAIFGAGAAIGGIFGGIMGAKLYAINRTYLPLFMGFTLASSAVMMKSLLSLDLSQAAALETAFPLLILSGSFAAVNGANIRVVFINLTSPESRGAAIALLNFVNCMGRGCGPTVVEAWMEAQQLGRREAMSSMLNLWLVAGALLCVASTTIVHDEERLKLSLKKYADECILKANNGITMSALSVEGGDAIIMEISAAAVDKAIFKAENGGRQS